MARIGFRQLDQTGSHVILFKQDETGRFRPIVPLHHELAIGTFLSIIKQAGLIRDEFFELYYGKRFVKT